MAETRRVIAVGDGILEPEVRRHLTALASADGNTIIICQVAQDSLRHALKSGSWDAVVLSRDCASLARRIPGKVPVYIHQDWAYARSYSGDVCVDPRFAAFGYDQKTMYSSIVNDTRTLCMKYGAGVVPVGTAVQNIRATQDRDNITRDGVHLNFSIGCYVAACVWYETLFGTDVTGSAYNPGRLPDTRIRIARGGAHAAVSAPWEVTDYGFRTLHKNYDEAKVGEYQLPDPLVMSDGTPVTSARQWYSERRPELLELFTTQMYGRAPGRLDGQHYELISCDDGALSGTAVRKEVRIYFTESPDRYMTLLIYLPKQVRGPVPLVLGANFNGNASILYDTGISYPDSAQTARYSLYTEPPRGSMQGRWPVGMILSRGYGLATFCRTDLDPEFDDSFTNGVHPLSYRDGQTCPAPDEWGSIAAWAWGYSRALDYLETDTDVDASRVCTVGHSRLAKTALWAAVTDSRFAMAFPNNSGCCGAALSRRDYGETLETMILHYHYWYCQNFWKYSSCPDTLPFDQHELLSLMAPRPVYITSGEHDRWSDPKGEFLSAVEASKVYEFLGLPGLGVTEMPGPWKPVHTGLIGYHMRSGPHAITAYDWAQFLDFADMYLK